MTSIDAVEEAGVPEDTEPPPKGAPPEDAGTVIVSGCGDAPAPEEPDAEAVACEPAGGTFCVPEPDKVRVRTPVDPEGAPGPGGTVYVITSSVGVDEAAEADPLAPDPDVVTVLDCDELPDSDPGTVTVRGWGDEPLELEPDMMPEADSEDEAGPVGPVAGDSYGVNCTPLLEAP